MRIASATGLDGRLQRRKRSPAASERLQSRPYGSPSEKTGRGAEGERAFVGRARRREIDAVGSDGQPGESAIGPGQSGFNNPGANR